MDERILKKILEKPTVYEITKNMTCEELTGAYVILREVINQSKQTKNLECFRYYLGYVKNSVCASHEEKLEDMRQEFYEKGKNNVQH